MPPAQLPGSAPALAATKAKKKVAIVFYSSIGYDKAVSNAFTAKYHIPVEIDHNPTGTVLSLIEASRDNPKWGIWWTDGAKNMTLLDSQHLLVKHFEPTDAHWTALGHKLVPKDGSYVPTGATIAAALVYDKTKVTDPPKTWLDLLQPRWKNQVGMNDPSISGPTYPFVAGMMEEFGGVTQGEDYFSALNRETPRYTLGGGEAIGAPLGGVATVAGGRGVGRARRVGMGRGMPGARYTRRGSSK